MLYARNNVMYKVGGQGVIPHSLKLVYIKVKNTNCSIIAMQAPRGEK